MNLKPIETVINLSGRRKSGESLRKPCPSKTAAVLGFDEPILIPCGRIEGHEGDHEYRITWSGETP